METLFMVREAQAGELTAKYVEVRGGRLETGMVLDHSGRLMPVDCGPLKSGVTIERVRQHYATQGFADARPLR